MPFKLICLDLDGVLFKDVNFWLELHKAFGTYEQGAALTQQYLHTDYPRLVEEVVVNLWKGKDAAPYFTLVNRLEYLPGVPELFAKIRRHGLISAIISASSIEAARRVQRDYGVDYVFANELVIRNGKVLGEFVWPIGAGREKKAQIVRELCDLLKISPREAAYIGDSDADLEAFRIVGRSIAFNCASDALKSAATHVVDSADLRDALPYLAP